MSQASKTNYLQTYAKRVKLVGIDNERKYPGYRIKKKNRKERAGFLTEASQKLPQSYAA